MFSIREKILEPVLKRKFRKIWMNKFFESSILIILDKINSLISSSHPRSSVKRYEETKNSQLISRSLWAKNISKINKPERRVSLKQVFIKAQDDEWKKIKIYFLESTQIFPFIYLNLMKKSTEWGNLIVSFIRIPFLRQAPNFGSFEQIQDK